MPIPQLTNDGVLPAGVHDCSMEEVKTAFGWFGTSGKRYRLWLRLVEFVGQAVASDLVAEVIIDGSFVTAAADPSDVDLLIGIRERTEGGLLRPMDYNVISKRVVKRKYEFDILVALTGSPEFAGYVEFFSQVKGRPEATKGLLRVKP